VSNQIGVSGESPSPAGRRRKPKELPNRNIVPLATVPLAAPPSKLAHLFADPPLVGNEKREDFDRFFSAIAAASKPVDAIAWLFTWDIAYLSWEIRRERVVKADIIKSAQLRAVGRFLVLIDEGGSSLLIDVGANDRAARRWASDSKSRREIDQKLAANGYGPSDILAEAYIRGAPNIDAIDRRLASYEARRMTTLRELEIYSEKFASKLAATSRDIVDAEFTVPTENA
jgi:hypothetical protein